VGTYEKERIPSPGKPDIKAVDGLSPGGQAY